MNLKTCSHALPGAFLTFPRIALIGALALAGCGGDPSSDGSNEDIEGLSVAESMTVVTTSGGSALVAPRTQADTSGFPADCDYNTDVAHSHVYDPSMDTLQTVNMILCLLKQTAYSGLLNEGVYKAQIDEASCESGGDNSSSGSATGQSTGAAQEFNVWVIESSRASNAGAQTVEFWIPDQEGNDENGGEIRVRMTISKGVSDDNPFGVFNLDFIEFNSAGDQIRGFGNLHTLDVLDGFIGFSFYQEEGDVDSVPGVNEHSRRTQANVNMFADQSQGVARIVNVERFDFGSGDSGPQTTEYQLAFDATNVLRSTNGNAGTCLSRTDFQQRTWRYNLYDSETGDRVELESGFGFTTEDGHYGWIGYYGLWVPPDVTLSSGDTVTRNTYGNSAAQTYTVVKAPGKLVKNTRQTLALVNLDGQTFDWWYFDGEIGARYRVIYDHGKDVWLQVAVWNAETHQFDTLESPMFIPVAKIGFLGMYSDTLGGQVSYTYGNEYITYYTHEFVGPSSDLFTESTTVDLYGYANCLAAGILGRDAQNGDVFLPESFDAADPYHFVFDKSTMTLSLDTGEDLVAVGLARGETYEGGPNAWGMQSGPMVLSFDGFEDTHEVWSQDVFYTYETGPNSWNQYATLLDDTSTAVVFDPPLQFSYRHHTADDANDDETFDGQTFLLTYNGPGDFWGIPNYGVDFDSDGNPDRWFPSFSIKDGTLCGPTGTEYVIRAIESEYTLANDPTGCTLLTVGPVGSLPLPTLDDWTDPAIGAIPEVNDPPRVIEGEVLHVTDG